MALPLRGFLALVGFLELAAPSENNTTGRLHGSDAIDEQRVTEALNQINEDVMAASRTALKASTPAHRGSSLTELLVSLADLSDLPSCPQDVTDAQSMMNDMMRAGVIFTAVEASSIVNLCAPQQPSTEPPSCTYVRCVEVAHTDGVFTIPRLALTLSLDALRQLWLAAPEEALASLLISSDTLPDHVACVPCVWRGHVTSGKTTATEASWQAWTAAVKESNPVFFWALSEAVSPAAVVIDPTTGFVSLRDVNDEEAAEADIDRGCVAVEHCLSSLVQVRPCPYHNAVVAAALASLPQLPTSALFRVIFPSLYDHDDEGSDPSPPHHATADFVAPFDALPSSGRQLLRNALTPVPVYAALLDAAVDEVISHASPSDVAHWATVGTPSPEAPSVGSSAARWLLRAQRCDAPSDQTVFALLVLLYSAGAGIPLPPGTTRDRDTGNGARGGDSRSTLRLHVRPRHESSPLDWLCALGVQEDRPALLSTAAALAALCIYRAERAPECLRWIEAASKESLAEVVGHFPGFAGDWVQLLRAGPTSPARQRCLELI